MTYARSAHTVFIDMLGTLEHLVEAAREAGATDAVLSQTLAEDMFPLELQFRVALNQVILALNQVAGQSIPLEGIGYRSLHEISERIVAVRSILQESSADEWAPAEAIVDLTLPNGVRFLMSAEEDVRDWLLPNFYFHVTMVYALLRHAGVKIGKMDFLRHMNRHTVSASGA